MDWDPEDIKATLRKAGVSIAELSRRLGVSRQALRHTLWRPNARGEAAIASALGLNPAAIWPSRYDGHGQRKAPQPVENYRSEPARDASRRSRERYGVPTAFSTTLSNRNASARGTVDAKAAA